MAPEDQEFPEVRCEGCGEMVSTDTCWCGLPMDHPPDEQHAPIPMGCDCFSFSSDKGRP